MASHLSSLINQYLPPPITSAVDPMMDLQVSSVRSLFLFHQSFPPFLKQMKSYANSIPNISNHL